MTLTGEEGAVNAPLELMVPALADHLTAEFRSPVPCTVAVHCEVAVGATVVGVQEMATDETCEETGCDGGDDGEDGEDGGDPDMEPPQAAHTSIPNDANRSHMAERPGNGTLGFMRNESSGMQKQRA